MPADGHGCRGLEDARSGRCWGMAFTANPITGTRTEMVVDAVANLGTSVVDGSAAADDYVISEDRPVTAGAFGETT
jgi:phosphoenolpyruvate synthase/pyruvate phosphate dikinase